MISSRRFTSCTSPLVTRINVGMLPCRSSKVCILTAALRRRNFAHGNSDRHRSMVVESRAGGAASAALFMSYLAAFVPWVAHGSHRAFLLFTLIAIPTAANYIGVRSGASLSALLTLLKLVPLALIIGLGVIRFSHHVEFLHASDITSPGRASWLSAILLLAFSYSGADVGVGPAGDISKPRRTVHLALHRVLLGVFM